MGDEDARAVAGWRYPAPYDFYNADQDADDLAELLDPQQRRGRYFSVLHEDAELLGFFTVKTDQRKATIGLGLRPDLTGKGCGLSFVLAVLEYVRTQTAPEQFCLVVATFNQRAIRVYERAGFRPTRTFLGRTNGGEYEFLEMIRDAQWI